MNLNTYPFEWFALSSEGESKQKINLPAPRESFGYV